VALAVVAALVLSVASRPAGSRAVRKAAVASPGSVATLPRFGVPSAYHVVYRETAADGSVSTEQLWVERPFGSVDLNAAGPPPGAATYLETVDRLGAQVLRAGSATPALLDVPAAPAGGDLRLDAVLPDAVRGGFLRVLGTETLVGRSCTVLRSAKPLRSGPLVHLGSGSSYVDSCVDADGLVLEERSVDGGRMQSERMAVSVTVGTDALGGSDLAAAGVATPFDQGGGSFTAITLDSRPPGGSWELPNAPAGFVHSGRYAVVPPQPQVFSSASDQGPPNPSGLPGALVVEMDDVYVNGPDVIVIQQGETMNGAKFTAPAGGTSVELGALGPGQLILGAASSQVMAEPFGAQRFLRVTGTISPDALLALARSLVLAPGGTITKVAP